MSLASYRSSAVEDDNVELVDLSDFSNYVDAVVPVALQSITKLERCRKYKRYIFRFCSFV